MAAWLITKYIFRYFETIEPKGFEFLLEVSLNIVLDKVVENRIDGFAYAQNYGDFRLLSSERTFWDEFSINANPFWDVWGT